MPKKNILKSLAVNGWVQNTSVAALGILTAAICAIMKMSFLKTSVITACVVLTALVWIVGTTIIRTYDSPDTGLKIKVLFAVYSNDSAVWWLRWRSRLGDTISPMPIVLSISITNTKDIPVTLESLATSAQVNDGGWVEFRHVNTRVGEVYFMSTGLQDAGLLDLSKNGLDNLLLNPIEPHKTVRGLLFFDTPTPLPVVGGDNITYRWTAKDAAGEQYAVTVVDANIKTSPPGTPAAQFGTTTEFTFTRAHIDLRGAGLKATRWNEAGVFAVPNK